jgi:hypothetical protein
LTDVHGARWKDWRTIHIHRYIICKCRFRPLGVCMYIQMCICMCEGMCEVLRFDVDFRHVD